MLTTHTTSPFFSQTDSPPPPPEQATSKEPTTTTMVASILSLVSLYGMLLRYFLSSAGLSSQTINIDEKTTIHFWGPKFPSKPPLLLIHGFGPAGAWQWQPQIAYFAPLFDLYVPDLVFFGDSTTQSSNRSEVFQAQSVGKMMEQLGVGKYAVVGTSYGGFVAYHMAAMWPERLEKVVIASSAVNLRLRDNTELLKRANVGKIDELMLPQTAAQLRTLLRFVVHSQLYVPDFLLNDIIDTLYSENRKEKLELLQGLTIGQDDTVKISPLQQDVLIMWGDHDQIFLPEKAIELKELLGEKAKLEVINNTSHLPQIENAEQFNNILENFLRSPS